MKQKQTNLFDDFNTRVVEVSQYFMFLKTLEKKAIIKKGSNIRNVKIYIGIDQNNISQIYFNDELEETLKATGFLLLYNLIESTIRNAIIAILDELICQKICFDDINIEMQKIILENFKKQKSDEFLENLQNISFDIVSIELKQLHKQLSSDVADKSFSGNLDAKKIRGIAEAYGFSSHTNPKKTRDGFDLKTIKEKRNSLAHGRQSFREMGKDQGTEELFKIKNRVILYLKEILQNVDSYLDNQEYLKFPPRNYSDVRGLD